MTKNQRQRMIADWLREHRVGSQEELVARLSMSGIAATQATVSRDLLELGAVKLKREGSIRYVMPDQVEVGHAAAKLDRLMAEWVDAIIPAGNLIVLKTPPASDLLRKAAGVDKGSRAQKREKVGSISRAQLLDIANQKMKDLNAADVESAARMIEGSARSMGIEVN